MIPMGMTGFGRHMADLPQGRLTAEVRTLNARGRELHVRVQGRLAVDENALRAELASHFGRGRIELSVSLVLAAPIASAPDAAVALVEDLRARLSGRDILLNEVLLARLVLALERTGETGSIAPDPEAVLAAVRSACIAAKAARMEEGAATARAIQGILERISGLLEQIAQAHPQWREAAMHRLAQRLREAGADPDAVFAREIVQAADRADVTEELSRLQGHLHGCGKLLESGGPVGRELDFLGQELLREANTIGSKCSDARITAAVIAMKTASEQMRELAANLE